VLSQEGVEDNRRAAAEDLGKLALTKDDMVIGLAASTRTPYTLAGLEHAQEVGARTAFIVCNRLDEEAREQEVIKRLHQLIELPVGPEVITGSTRMKSGTAQKMALNIISTTAMVLLGKTLGNLMIDLQSRSEKLAARSRKILIDLLSVSDEEADDMLDRANGSVKLAIVMHAAACDRETAAELLSKHKGFVRPILNISSEKE
jgi:N-acetylmuramic acid 6-phosphate etherase